MPLETKRKLIKFSNYSFCLTLPKTAIDQLGWGKGDEVTVIFDEQKQLMTVSKTSTIKNQKSTPEPQPSTRQVPGVAGGGKKPKLRW